MKGATEGVRERSAGRLLRRHAVHRSPIAIVDQRHGDDLHEIVEMNPRQVLLARSDGPAHSQLERWQHLRQRATGPAEYDARAQQHDTRAQPLGVHCGALPPPAQPRQKILAAAGRFREGFITAVAVIADGASGDEDARANLDLRHGPHQLPGHRDAAAFEDGAAAGRPPAAHQRFARQIHHGVAALDCRDQPAERRVSVNQFDLGTQEAPGARRRSHPRDDGMPVALEPRNQRPADETGRARHEHTHVTPFLDLSAVVRPVKDGLPLPPPTFEIARFAVLPNRRHVSSDRTPASNLPRVVGGSPAHVVAAIPLKPPARILSADPAAAAPDGERLRRVHAEIVQARVMPLDAQLGASEPAPWKLLLAVRHVLPAEDAEPQHLFRRQIRHEPRREVPADRLGAPVDVAALHPIGDDDFLPHRRHTWFRNISSTGCGRR